MFFRFTFLTFLSVALATTQTDRRSFAETRIVSADYPWLARLSGTQGSAVIAAQVLPDGTVREVRVVSGPYLLGKAAKEAVAKWLFEPRKAEDGSYEVRVVFAFELEGTCAASKECPIQFQMDLPDRAYVKAKFVRPIMD